MILFLASQIQKPGLVLRLFSVRLLNAIFRSYLLFLYKICYFKVFFNPFLANVSIL